ncbi:hypothetical protein [Actinomadura rubrisoli]|uniref:Uncharacterized protein n=1 Tax=Actinomadura rubrisoli TaxID=2530368 RepID=A0A4R5AD42_9ACTN|nr:hypothetical protein [Actinomadura rubrisoli]TDD70378.1 hypothetical protein E1298_36630 [Actinomadura rubrisoli]
MRLLSVTALGTALVAAGLVAPAAGEAAGEATRFGRGGMAVQPGAARPGQRVEVSVPGCSDGHRVSSKAFTKDLTLDGKAGRGTATVKRDAKAGKYTIVAHCGARKVSGEFRVSGGLAWPAILPTTGNRL